MLNAIIGTKINQSQIFDQMGNLVPVTNIKTGPLHVVCIKSVQKDGYNAIQLGLGERRAKTISQAQRGHLKKSGMEKNPPRFLREIRFQMESESEMNKFQPGEEIKAGNILKPGDLVAVTGTTKGKGFQGGVKRHNFKGGPRTHGQSDRERAPGSIGQTTTPGRVYKGKRMAGRMGHTRVRIQNLEVVTVDDEHNLLTIKGLVPGARNGLLIINKTV